MELGKKIAGYGKTRDKALANRDKALKRAITGTQHRSNDNIESTLKRYYHWLDSSDRKPNTLTRKKDRLQRYFKPYMSKPLKELDEDIVIEIIAKAKANSKHTTFSKIPNQIYSEIHQFLDWALKCKLIESNPTLLVEKPSWKSRARAANEEFIDQRIAFGKDLLDYAARNADIFGVEYGILLIASLGLRAGEIRGLTWDCFEGLRGGKPSCVLHVRQQYDRDAATGEWKLVKWTKTDAGTRKIAVPLEWRTNLLDYYDWLYDHVRASEVFCFVTRDGEPFTSGQMNKRWRILKNAYEEEKRDDKPGYKLSKLDATMRLYDMRHVAASLLVSSGQATIDQVRPILGHMDPKMTEYYTHLTMESEHRIMNTIPGLMGSGAPFWNFFPEDDE
jgi:integrase